MARIAAGVVAGLLAWIVIATVGNFALRAVLPGYVAVEASMDFTLVMMICRLLLGALSSFGAGLVTASIARRGGAGSAAIKILIGILLVVFLPTHYRLWDKFPIWYHLTFLLSLVALTLLGAVCYSRYARSSRPDAASDNAPKHPQALQK